MLDSWSICLHHQGVMVRGKWGMGALKNFSFLKVSFQSLQI